MFPAHLQKRFATLNESDQTLLLSLKKQIEHIDAQLTVDEKTNQLSNIILSTLSRNQNTINSSSSKIHLCENIFTFLPNSCLPENVERIDALKYKIAERFFFKEEIYKLNNESLSYLSYLSYDSSLSIDGINQQKLVELTNRNRICFAVATKELSFPYEMLEILPQTLLYGLLEEKKVNKVLIIKKDAQPLTYSGKCILELIKIEQFNFEAFEMFTVKFAEDLSSQVPKAILLSHKWFQSCLNAGMSEIVERLIDFSDTAEVKASPDFYYVGFEAFVDQIMQKSRKSTSIEEKALEEQALKAFLDKIIPTSILFDQTVALENGKKALFNALNQSRETFDPYQDTQTGITYYGFHVINPINWFLNQFKNKNPQDLLNALDEPVEKGSFKLPLVISFLSLESMEDFILPEELKLFKNLQGIRFNRFDNALLNSLKSFLMETKLKSFKLNIPNDLKAKFQPKIEEIASELNIKIDLTPVNFNSW